jgi:prephenate dehydratase
MIKKVAIQGVKGSFHHLVTQNYFATAVETEPFLTFKEAVNALTEKKSRGCCNGS